MGATLGMFGCADYLTGQPQEPQGPIQILKLTLFDAASRDVPVFTDTSVPDCTPVTTNMVDCTSPDMSGTTLCQDCYLDVRKDMYSPQKSPPTPDSGQDIRVVFNKEPLLLNGAPIANDDMDHSDPTSVLPENALKLQCSGCSGLPPNKHFLVVSGSQVSFDPTVIAYGPSLQIQVDTTDPRAALEPATEYSVQVSPGVAGRDGAAWVPSPAQMALLSFTTEPFKVLSVGRSGGMSDQWVYSQTEPGTYMIADQPLDAAVVLRLNASIFAAGLPSINVTAIAARPVGSTSVMVQLASNLNQDTTGMTCVQASQRLLYIYPTAGTWPSDASEVDIHIPGGGIFDVLQGASYGKGMHSIENDIDLTVKFTTTMTTGYTTIGNAITASKC